MKKIYPPPQKNPKTKQNKRTNRQTNNTKTRTSTCLLHIYDRICSKQERHLLIIIEYKKTKCARREQTQCYIVLLQL